MERKQYTKTFLKVVIGKYQSEYWYSLKKKNPLLFGNWLVDKVAILIKLENYDLKEEEKYNYCYIGYFLTFRKKSIYKYKKKKEKFNARETKLKR